MWIRISGVSLGVRLRFPVFVFWGSGSLGGCRDEG